MSEPEEFAKGLFDTLITLEDYLDKIILVGGWCPFLYANYLWRKKIPGMPTTSDIDFGVIETGPLRFKQTVYDKLKEAGFTIERIYEGEEEPVEFVYKEEEFELKVEFITSFETSDDTLNRFLGKGLACNRIEAFEILLENPVQITIPHPNRKLPLNIPRPETFLFHKAVTFAMRSFEPKRDKDLFYVYFVMKFCPDQKALLRSLDRYRTHELFKSFKENLSEYLSDVSKPGYQMLRPFLRSWVDEKKINGDIHDTFIPLFQFVKV